MALFVVLEDYADGTRTLRAGTLVDDAIFPVPELVRSGLAAVPFVPGTMAAALAGFLAQRGSRPPSFSPDGDLSSLLLAAGAIGGGGGGGGWNYIFDPLATQDPAQNLYSSWADLCAHILTLPLGVKPQIEVVRNANVPVAGMPASGWYMRDANLVASSFVTGAVTLTIDDGAKLDSLGGWSDGLTLAFSPSVITDTLNFTTLATQYPGLPWVLFIGRGANYQSTGAQAPLTGPGTGQYIVLATNAATLRAGPPPPQALVNITGADICIESQQFSGFFGSLPDGYLIGNGNLVRQVGIDTQVALIPGFIGVVLLTATAQSVADRIIYDDALVAPPLGAVEVQGAIDAIKPLLGGGGGSAVISASGPFVVPAGVTRLTVYGRPGAGGGGGGGGSGAGNGGGPAGGGGGGGRGGGGGGSAVLQGPTVLTVVPGETLTVVIAAGGAGGAGGAPGAAGTGPGGGGITEVLRGVTSLIRFARASPSFGGFTGAGGGGGAAGSGAAGGAGGASGGGAGPIYSADSQLGVAGVAGGAGGGITGTAGATTAINFGGAPFIFGPAPLQSATTNGVGGAGAGGLRGGGGGAGGGGHSGPGDERDFLGSGTPGLLSGKGADPPALGGAGNNAGAGGAGFAGNPGNAGTHGRGGGGGSGASGGGASNVGGGGGPGASGGAGGTGSPGLVIFAW